MKSRNDPTKSILSGLVILATLLISGWLLTNDTFAACCTPPPGMVSWWAGEGDGANVLGGPVGILLDGAGFAEGKAGQAFSFNGLGSRIDFGKSVGNFGTSDFSVEFWFSSSSTASFEYLLSKRSVCAHSSFWNLYIENGQVLAEIDGDSNGSNFIWTRTLNSQSVKDGKWHHIALVRKANRATLVLDGKVYVSAAQGVANLLNDAPLIAGTSVCVGVNGSRPYKGLMDEISIYNRALTTNEIGIIMEAGPGGKCDAVSPSFLLNPTGRIAFIGEDATLSAVATGSGQMNFIWLKNGQAIPSKNGVSLALGNLQSVDAGLYTLLASNSFGITRSDTVELIVEPSPVIYETDFESPNFEVGSMHGQDGWLAGSSSTQHGAEIIVATNNQVAILASPGETGTEEVLKPLFFEPFASRKYLVSVNADVRVKAGSTGNMSNSVLSSIVVKDDRNVGFTSLCFDKYGRVYGQNSDVPNRATASVNTSFLQHHYRMEMDFIRRRTLYYIDDIYFGVIAFNSASSPNFGSIMLAIASTNRIGSELVVDNIRVAGFGPPRLTAASPRRVGGNIIMDLSWLNLQVPVILENAQFSTGPWSPVVGSFKTNTVWVTTALTNATATRFYRLRAD